MPGCPVFPLLRRRFACAASPSPSSCAGLLVGLLAPVVRAEQEDLYDLYQKRDLQGCLDAALPRLGQAPEDRDLNQLVGRCLVEIGRPGEARPVPGEGDQRLRTEGLALRLRVPEPGHRAVVGRGSRGRPRPPGPRPRPTRKLAPVTRNAEIDLAMSGLAAYYADWHGSGPASTSTAGSRRASPRERARGVRAAGRRDLVSSRRLLRRRARSRRAEVLIWPDAATAAKVAGVPMLGYTFADLCVVHTLADLPLGQDLAPVFLRWVTRPTEPARFLAEGVAEICDGRDGRSTVSPRRARRSPPPGSPNLDIPRWWQDHRAIGWGVVRPVSGAFVQALLDRGGQEKLRAAPARSRRTCTRGRSTGRDQLDAIITEFTATVRPK